MWRHHGPDRLPAQSTVRVDGHPTVTDERFAPDSEIRVSGSDSVTYVLEAYCADFDKDNPSETVTFSLGREDPVVACIVAQSGTLSVSTIQAAVWIHTGKVTYRAMACPDRSSGNGFSPMTRCSSSPLSSAVCPARRPQLWRRLISGSMSAARSFRRRA